MRERIKGFSQIIQSTPSGVQFGLVILDESDEMTRDAQTALRRIMETLLSNLSVHFDLQLSEWNHRTDSKPMLSL